jgi:Uma2 family endonuclease
MKVIRNLFRKNLTQEEFQSILNDNEKDIVELQDMNVDLIRKTKDLEKKLEFYQERLKILEGIKIEEKSKVNLWKILAGIGAAIGAIIGSWLTKDDKD